MLETLIVIYHECARGWNDNCAAKRKGISDYVKQGKSALRSLGQPKNLSPGCYKTEEEPCLRSGSACLSFSTVLHNRSAVFGSAWQAQQRTKERSNDESWARCPQLKK